MENYKKGKNVQETLTKEKILIKCLPENFIWMQVRGGSKMRNLLDYALTEFETQNSIVWTGSGSAIGKAISCAEIMKRKFTVHQINKICFTKVEEHWDPVLEDLDALIVTREIPTMHILLSKEPLDTTEPGFTQSDDSSSWRISLLLLLKIAEFVDISLKRFFSTAKMLKHKSLLSLIEFLKYQAPVSSESWRKNLPRSQNKDGVQKQRIDRKQFESLGLRSAYQKRMKTVNNNKTKNEKPAKQSKKNLDEVEPAAESSGTS